MTTCAEGISTGPLGFEATLTAQGQAPLFFEQEPALAGTFFLWL